MPAPSRTYQKSPGMYYIRLIIPEKLIPYVNIPKIIYSLKTKDRQVAYVSALKINLAFEEWLKGMAIGDSKRFPELKVQHEGTSYDFNLDSPAEKAAYDDLIEQTVIRKAIKNRKIFPNEFAFSRQLCEA